MTKKWWLGDLTARDPLTEFDALRRTFAQLLAADEELWPSHGNAPLAIASAMAIASSLAEQRLEELTNVEADRDRIIADAHQMTQDLHVIAHELGIPARPYSGHEAMERDILPEIRRLRQIEAVYESIMKRTPSRDLYFGNPTPPPISEKEREWRGG